MEQAWRFQDSLHATLSWFLDPRSTVLDAEGEHRSHAIAAHLACCYTEMGRLAPVAEPVVKEARAFDGRTYLEEDGAYRQRVVDLCATVRAWDGEFISAFYLHGSLATLDYAKGWSDVDTFLVIRQDVVTDPRRLHALRQRCLEAWPLFLAVTPLQHHGFIVATDEDLTRYPSHYLPLPVFDHALAVAGTPAPAFRPRPAAGGGSLRALVERRDALADSVKTGVLKHHPKNGVYLERAYRNAGNAMSQLHALLDYVMLVPAVFLDALGQPCYKRESFHRARPYLSDAAWQIVDRASAVRRMWPDAEGLHYTGNAVPRWLQDELGPAYLEDAHRLLDEAVRAAGSE